MMYRFIRSPFASPSPQEQSQARGFALVVTISIMVLLALLAVGLLSLSNIAVRSSAKGAAQAEARANARMALELAIGALQRELGPDRRINCAAGIDDKVLPEHRQWLSVYDAWPAEAQERPEPDTRFRRFLVSSQDPEALKSREAAKTAIAGEAINLVSQRTLGEAASDESVQAGLVSLEGPGNKPRGTYAWWVGDENAKASITAGRDIPAGISDELLAQQAAQSAPGVGFRLVDALADVAGTGRESWELGDDLRAKTVTSGSAELLPGSADTIGEHFHDITTRSRGLLTDVRNGGLRRDLSLYFQQDYSKRLRQPLYTLRGGASVNFAPDSSSPRNQDRLDEFSGITMEELWLYHNLYQEVSYNRPASSDAKVGSIPRGYPTLVSGSTREEVIRDPFYVYKRRIYSQVKYILSLAAVPNSKQRGKYDLRVSVDPVVVLWNPNNVALEYQVGGFTTVGFSSLPYECKFAVTGSGGTRTTTVPFSKFFGSVNGVMAQVGRTHRIVLRPGESRVFSPSKDESGSGSIKTDLESGWEFTTGAVFSSADFPKELSRADQVRVTLQPKIETAKNDYITYWFGSRGQKPALQSGTISLQHDMDIGDELPVVTAPQDYSVSNILDEEKVPLMLFSYYLRPENDTETPSKSWIWSNPAIIYRWPADDSIASLLHRQFEMKVIGLDNWENPYVQVTPDNQAYWGGGVRADFGVPFFSFRSIPLTPLQSLGSLQHACANGFRRHWKDSPISIPSGSFPSNAYALDGYQYLAPKASKVIGNSFSHPLISGDQVEGKLFAHLGAGNSASAQTHSIADHSYLANAALWDSWYFSSLASQTVESYGSNRRDLQEVFDDFFPESTADGSVPLPSVRMQPYRSGNDGDIRKLVRNGKPDGEAYRQLAAHLMVDGAFNVNSTSVTAWKTILGSLRGHATARRDRDSAKPSLELPSTGETPVNSLVVANGPRSEPTGDPQEPDQWTGFRMLDDQQIEDLATELVEEIRRRGPFLCLSDFVNRRPGRNSDFARHGALQAAIEKAGLNDDFDKAFRAVGAIAGAAFPEAGEGSRAAGIPGYISQGDLLTPLGPVLTARSDSFVIRAYGSATGANGEVLSRAWCEATIQRIPEFLDPADEPETPELSLGSDANQTFGRQLKVVSFRWLNSAEV